MYPGPQMGQGRMPAGTSRAPVRSRSLNTERLNATAVNMLAEFLRTNHPSLAPMAFEFWTIADVPLDHALAHLFRSVHKPGIPPQHHNGPLDYSATTLKSYFSSLSRVFAANRPAPRGFHSEPFKSGVAVALERRIREMSAEAAAVLAAGGRGIGATVIGGGIGSTVIGGDMGMGVNSVLGVRHLGGVRGAGGAAVATIETATSGKAAAAGRHGSRHMLASLPAPGSASGVCGQRQSQYSGAAASGGRQLVKKQPDFLASSRPPTNSQQFDGLSFGGSGLDGCDDDEDDEDGDDDAAGLFGLNGLNVRLNGGGGGGGDGGGAGLGSSPLRSDETPVVPDSHFIMLWNAVSSGSDPIKHLLRLFLTAATLFGDANSFLANMRVSDFVIEPVAEGEYIGRNALVLRSRIVAKRAHAAALKLAEESAAGTSAVSGKLGAAGFGAAATSASACLIGDDEEDSKSGLHYIVDMPEMGEGNNYYVLKEYMDCRPPGAGDNFWLNCSRDRTAPRDSFYSPSVMSIARIGSLINELYAETGISNTLGCINHSLHLRIMPKVNCAVGGNAAASDAEAVLPRGRGRPRSAHPVARPVSAATAFRRAADRRASQSADGARRVPPPVPSVELIIKLGGAALTDKANRRQLAPMERFDGTIECVANAYKRGTRLIVCMGAGSYGHFEAAECKVTSGSASTQGVSSTHAAVSTLAAFVVDSLAKKGVPAVTVSPLHVSLCGSTLERAVANAVTTGFLPVVHGDAMYDAGTATSSIFSGDDALAQLATATTFPNIRRAVFVSDVAGVFQQPPPPAGGAGRELGAIFGSDNVVSSAESSDILSGLVRSISVDSSGNPVPGSCSIVTKRADRSGCDDGSGGGGIIGELGMKTGDKDELGACPDVTGGMGKKLSCAGAVAGKTKGRVDVYIVGAGSSSMTAAIDVVAGSASQVAGSCTRVVFDGEAGDERQGEGRTAAPRSTTGSGSDSLDSEPGAAPDASRVSAGGGAGGAAGGAAGGGASAVGTGEDASAATATGRGSSGASDAGGDDVDAGNDVAMGVDDSESMDDIGGKLSGGIGALPSDMFAAVTTS